MQKLHARFGKLVVVFDGSRPDSKMETVRKRRESALTGMSNVQKREAWDSSERNYGTPHFIMFVFMEVLRDLESVEIILTNGEADNAVAALANHHKCPVLASDSDYFIFELKHGFIQLNDWLSVMDAHNPNIESIRMFNVRNMLFKDVEGSFSLSEYDQWLLIPAIFGNDIINHIQNKPEHLRSFQAVFKKASEFRNCQQFLDFCMHRNYFTGLSENFAKAKEMHCNLPKLDSIPFSAAADKVLSTLPEWIFQLFREGKILPFLLEACSKEPCLLPKSVEVIEKKSVWHISCSIRQHLYALMGLPADEPVREVIRKDHVPKLTIETVSPILLTPPVTVENIESCDKKNLVLEILKYPMERMQLFDQLEDQWKLPVAATFYWYQQSSIPRDQREDLLKSLLLSFLTCSGIMSADLPQLPAVTSEMKQRHLTALHAFSQWQCVYFDARALNYLAREPFPTTNPASLYAGEVAMHYATVVPHGKEWFRAATTKGLISSHGWELIDKFLRIIVVAAS